MILICQESEAQIGGIVVSRYTEYVNAAGFSLSAGSVLQREAYFLGFAFDYSRSIAGPLSAAASLAYDREKEYMANSTEKIIKTWTLIGTINYSLDKLTFSTGLAKGFANTDNLEQRMRFNDGAWSTGFCIGYALPDLPFFDRDNISISSSIEYNISDSEWNLSFDLAFGWSF